MWPWQVSILSPLWVQSQRALESTAFLSLHLKTPCVWASGNYNQTQTNQSIHDEIKIRKYLKPLGPLGVLLKWSMIMKDQIFDSNNTKILNKLRKRSDIRQQDNRKSRDCLQVSYVWFTRSPSQSPAWTKILPWHHHCVWERGQLRRQLELRSGDPQPDHRDHGQ